MRNKILIFAVMVLLVSSLAGVGCAKAPAEVIVIKGLTMFPVDHPVNEIVQPWIDMVNEGAAGEVRIEWAGGPEVIGTWEQTDAVRTGMMGMMLYQPFAYNESFMPCANAEGLSEYMPWEERESGAYDLWVEIFAKFINGRYIGMTHSYAPFSIFLNTRVEKIEDFEGLIIRIMPLYEPMVRALGASPVIMPMTEIYTAMQRGVIDGFMTVQNVPLGFGLHEVSKYILHPAVFHMEGARWMNLDVWNSCPKHAQDVMIEAMIEMEIVGVEHAKELDERSMKVYLEAGVEIIELSPAETKEYVRIAYDETWAEVMRSAPEYGPKLKELLTKK